MAEGFEHHPQDNTEGNVNQSPPLPKERSAPEYAQARANLLAIAERDVNGITSVEKLVEVHRTTGIDVLTAAASQGTLEYRGQILEPYVYVLRNEAGNALFRVIANASSVLIEKFDDKEKADPELKPYIISPRQTTGFEVQLPSQEPLFTTTRDFFLGIGASATIWRTDGHQSLHPFYNSAQHPTYPDDIRHYASLLKEGITGIIPQLAEPAPTPTFDLPPTDLE